MAIENFFFWNGNDSFSCLIAWDIFSVSLVTIRCKRPQNIFQLGRNHQSCTRLLTTDHPLRSSTDHSQTFEDIWILENMIIFVILMKIALARHEVYKEMELVLKKESWNGKRRLFPVRSPSWSASSSGGQWWASGSLILCSISWILQF